MLDAPRQDWDAYRALTAVHDRQALRNLTIADRFALYADLFQLVCGHPRVAAHQQRLDKRRWQQKLELRQRQNRAFGSVSE